jgi:hypothetical protein
MEGGTCTQERWAGDDLRLEYRLHLADSFMARAGLGPSAQRVGQTLTRRDADCISSAGYSSERAKSGWTFGATLALGSRFYAVSGSHRGSP